MFELITGIVAALLILAAYPVLEYSVLEPASRAKWGLREGPAVATGAGAYRVAVVSTYEAVRAPLVVRVTAFACFALGQLFLIGLPIAMLGIVIAVVIVGYAGGNSAGRLCALIAMVISALGIAGSLPGIGGALLRRTPNAASRARTVAMWSVLHNGVAFGWIAGFEFDFSRSQPVTGVLAGCILGHFALSIVLAGMLLASARATARWPALQMRALRSSVWPA